MREHAGNKSLSNLDVGLDNVADKLLIQKASWKCVVGPGVIKQLRYSKSLNLQTADSACFELKGTLRAPTNPNTGDRIIGAETATFYANKFEIHLSDTTTNSARRYIWKTNSRTTSPTQQTSRAVLDSRKNWNPTSGFDPVRGRTRIESGERAPGFCARVKRANETNQTTDENRSESTRTP